MENIKLVYIEVKLLYEQLCHSPNTSFIATIYIEQKAVRIWVYPNNLKDTVYESTIEIKLSEKNLVQSFEDLFFQNPIFNFPFKNIQLLYEPLYYVIAPKSLYQSEIGQSYLDLVKDPPIGSRPRGLGFLTQPLEFSLGSLEDMILVSEWDRELELFLKRNILGIHFSPYFASQFIRLEEISRNQTGNLFALLERSTDSFDIFVFNENSKLIFANAYYSTSQTSTISQKIDEQIFYILSIWKSLDLDSKRDRLFLLSKNYDSTTRQFVQILEERISQYLNTTKADLNLYYNANNIW